ncbi:MAG: hypothetical protein HY645_04765 [Acidobacteria bacterium]|nr:hypothetical protein [Acidobacteriota bacterium]
MWENFEEKPTYAKRYAQENLEQESLATRRQGIETLRLHYNWVAHFLNEHPGYRFFEAGEIPWTEFEGTLAESKVALVTTAGIYHKTQKPFSVSPGEVTTELMRWKFREKGDPSYRVISSSADINDLRIAHSYLDTSGAEEDINVVFPLRRLFELEEENFIASVAARHFSLSGYLPRPADVLPSCEQIVSQLRADHTDLAVLTPGEVLSHQTMAFVQNHLERNGIPTVSIALCGDLIGGIGVPRAVHYRFPFGFTLGDVSDEAMQLRILKDALRAIEEIREPGTVVDLPYQWGEE